jgi:hypothetical protein
VDGLEVQDEGDALVLAQVGQPVPGEQAFGGDNQAVAEGRERVEDGLGAGVEGAGQALLSLRVEDAQGQSPGVEIDAAVEDADPVRRATEVEAGGVALGNGEGVDAVDLQPAPSLGLVQDQATSCSRGSSNSHW